MILVACYIAFSGPQHVSLSVLAMALGGHVRVEVEDNIYYSKEF